MSKRGFVNNPAPPAAVYTYPNNGAQNHTVVVQQQPHVVTRSSGGLFSQLGRGLDQLGNDINREVNHLSRDIDRSFQTTATGQLLHGMFGSLGNQLNSLGKTISREVDWTAAQINKSLETTARGNVLNLFQTGSMIQLVSRTSGRCLEIVMGPSSLVVDGLGPDGAPHATWTIVNEGNNQVRLHNNNNFLAIINGNTVVLQMPQGVMHGVETKFQVSQIANGQFIYLESMKERGRHVGILQTGQVKPALATGKEQHSQFAVRVVHSMYGAAK